MLLGRLHQEASQHRKTVLLKVGVGAPEKLGVTILECGTQAAIHTFL